MKQPDVSEALAALTERVAALEGRVEAVEDHPALEPLRELERHPALEMLFRELEAHPVFDPTPPKDFWSGWTTPAPSRK